MNPKNNPLDVLIVRSMTRLRSLQERAGKQMVRGGSERGSTTIEQVLWAVAMIAIVAIVVTAITNFVNTQAGKIA